MELKSCFLKILTTLTMCILTVVQCDIFDDVNNKSKPVTNTITANWMVIAGGMLGGLLTVQSKKILNNLYTFYMYMYIIM